MENKKTDNTNDGQVIFTCPASKNIQQLRSEIAELKVLLTTSQSNKEALFDNEQLLSRYHISRTTAANWRAIGLGYVKVGKKILYDPKSVDEFLQKHKHKSF